MRIDGWEARLAALIEDARVRPYELGTHDCFRMACRVVEALTGIDRWPQFEGYRTRREAMLLLAAHGATFEDAFDWFFAVPRTDWRRARRGDIGAVQTVDGDKHLGVCAGAKAAFLAPSGLLWVEMPVVICAWRVG